MDVQQIIKDPNFLGLPEGERVKVLSAVDPNFSTLPDPEKLKVVSSFSQPQVMPVENASLDLQPAPSVPQPVTGNAMSAITPGTVGEQGINKSETLDRAVKNTPSSMGQVGKDFYNVIRHPIESAKSVGELALGVANLAIPGEHPSEESAKAVGDYLAQRYGSVEQIKETFATDPAGFALDLSSIVALPVAGSMAVAGKVGKVPSLVQGSKSLTKLGSVVDPVSYGVKAVDLGLKMLPEGTASNLYQRAAKFSTTLTKADRQKLTNTALDNAIMPTEKGLRSLDDAISGLNEQIAAKIDKAVNTGQTIPVVTLFRDFDSLMSPETLGALPKKGQNAIQRIRKEIVKANREINRVGLTPAEAQKMKQSIYKDLQSTYQKTMVTDASKKAQMAVARAAKESIEKIVPEIKHLNKADGDLIELRKHIERAANRISNHDMFSLRTLGAAGTGGVAAGPGGVAVGATLGIMGNPKVQAKLAIVVSKLQKQGFHVNPNGIAARLGLVQSVRQDQLRASHLPIMHGAQ